MQEDFSVHHGDVAGDVVPVAGFLPNHGTIGEQGGGTMKFRYDNGTPVAEERFCANDIEQLAEKC